MTGEKFDLITVGDASVDTYVAVPFIAGPDQKAIGSWLGVFGGGMAANFAAAAANAGARTSCLTVCGSDPAGQTLVKELSAHGVDTSGVVTVEGSTTFQCFVQLDPSGEKALFGAAPGKKVPDLSDLDPALFQRGTYVYVLADDIDWALEVAELARTQGAKVIVDLERTAIGVNLEVALNLASLSTIVFTNVGAFAELGLTNTEQIAQQFTDCACELLVITNGRHGSSVHFQGRTVTASGLQVPVLDTTGAGDAHNGAFAGRLLQGDDIETALRWATGMGALCAMNLGPRGYLGQLRTDLPTLINQVEIHHEDMNSRLQDDE